MMMGHSDDIVIKEVSQDSLSLSKKEFPLLNELRMRAEQGTDREEKLYQSANHFLGSIIPSYDDGKKAELFVVQLLGENRISSTGDFPLSTRDIFLLCICIRLNMCKRNLLEQNKAFIYSDDLWNDIIRLCYQSSHENSEIESSYHSNSSDTYSFVSDVLFLVKTIYGYREQTWADFSSREQVTVELAEDRSIKFSSYCKDPNDYYLMVNHVKEVKQVVNNLYYKTEKFKPCYQLLFKVYPTELSITYDETKYRIRRDTQITLEQENILKLLMGFKLYQNPYACLRELYQNSLDACRRRLYAKENKIGRGTIIFGKKVIDGKGTYLYCHDNGVGMDEHIIEDYLLRIGNSFYKSDDFLQERQQMTNEFTPVSQFGIGIISCFMIGTSIEIITKSIKPDSDYLYFCIGDVQGNIFYRRDIPEEDKALVMNCGTVVRVLLKEEFVSVIQTNSFHHIGFMQKLMTFPYKYANYKPYSRKELKEWENHLFTLISSFVCRPPENVDVFVALENNLPPIKFPRQPYVLKEGELGITSKDMDVFEKYYSRFGAKEHIRNSCHTYYLDVIKVGGICFYPIVTLPIENIQVEGTQSTYVFRNIHIFNTVGNKLQAIDGIFVGVVNTGLSGFGLLDYTGDDMPKLSVDRKSIISYQPNHDIKLQKIHILFKRKFRQLVAQHIKDYHLEKDKKTLHIIKLIGEEIGIS